MKIYYIIVSLFPYALSAVLVQPSLISNSPCQSKYGGGWILVRHAHNAWHSASDWMTGTESYGLSEGANGISPNDPEYATEFSIEFDSLLTDDTEILFSDGQCEMYLVTQWKDVKPSVAHGAQDGYTGIVLEGSSSNTAPGPWYNRGITNGAGCLYDPLITTEGWGAAGQNSNLNMLYCGNLHCNTDRFAINPDINVWVKGVSVDLCSDCPSNKVCDADTGDCTRDCDAFQIDEFLDDCSTKYDENVDGIADLVTNVSGIETRVGTAESDIGTINTKILNISTTMTQVRTDITGNDGEITNINTELGTIQTSLSALEVIDGTFETRVTALETRMNTMDTTVSDLGTSVNARIDSVEADFNADIDAVNARLDLYSAKSVNVGNVINDNVSEAYVYEWLSKDTLIILLLIMNMSVIMGAMVCILRNKARKKIVEYENVNVYSSADENQQLQS